MARGGRRIVARRLAAALSYIVNVVGLIKHNNAFILHFL